MKAIICEDNTLQRKAIVEIIENTILREELDLAIELVTSDGNEVIRHIKETPNYLRIYFLDVDLGDGENGIKVAQKIREQDIEGYIVFITSHADMSGMTFEYQVEAIDYIIKGDINNIKDRVNSCIMKAYKNKSLSKNGTYSVKVGDRIMHSRYEDILFFETSPIKHKIKIHEINKQVEFYGSLNELENDLDERFVRCHKSYIVNKDNIKEIDKKNRTIQMVNGEICYASAREIKVLL